MFSVVVAPRAVAAETLLELRGGGEPAAAAGLPDRLYDGDHYDIPQARYAAVVAAGAHEVAGRDLIRRLLATGLRRHQRHR